MNILIAYILIILIWSTTPLAIQWSSEGPGFLFSLTSRMLIGLLCLIYFNVLFRRDFPRHRAAVYTYIAGGIGIYGAMLSVYWGAQYIPSGWISVIFGLSPIFTTIFASILIKENNFSFHKLLALLFAAIGLALIFISSLEAGDKAIYGILAVLLSTSLHSASAVVIKRINASIHSTDSVIGSLLIALPVYILTWYIFDGEWPEHFSSKSIIAIAYLGIIATACGFALYYYVLKNTSVIKVAMIALISPVLALFLGNYYNHEDVSIQTLVGTLLILGSIVVHEILPEKKELE